ncbi:MAG: non-ribosomal peptide synthetase, partial [Acidobacteria bacterium]
MPATIARSRDPAYPGERLAFMLQDARAHALITEETLLAAFPPHRARVLCLDRDRDSLDKEACDPPRTAVLPGNLAYVIYTSGSTGRPKGAAIEHGSTVALLHWARQAFGDEDLAGVLASSSICFDSSVLEIFAPLSWGGTVILAENALELSTLKARQQVRLVNTVPSAIAELARTGGIPPSVRTVSLAGEALQNPLVQRIYEQKTIDRVINLYGLSEATVYTTMARPLRGSTDATPIGRPVSNARVYLLDGNLDPVSPGVPGEICVGGIGPGRGYLNRPDLTAERFIPDPFGDLPGARLYRTGDLGRFRPDGTIDFLGRIDQQVKIRGFRIEPGEIESVLASHPAIGETVVQVREERDGDRRLVAYVVPKSGPAPLSVRELRRYLAARLPEHMVPPAFVVLAALPRTPNGKLDRRALPAPGPSKLTADEAHVAPLTPEEKKLARLWGHVLKTDRVGLNDNFFEAGGHSLLATQLMSRLREAFKIDLSLRALFDAPTVAGLLRAIDSARAVSGEQAVQELRTAPRGGDLPLSFAQQRLWFLDRLEPGCAFYNIPAALRLVGALDAEALRRSLSEIVRRHEALRTTFKERLGEPVQDIAAATDLVLPVVDLGHVPAGGREAEVLRLARDEARAPFDLANGPLLRAGLVRLADDDHVLFLTTHHAVSDGWSMHVFLRELAHIYGAFHGGRPSPLAEPAFQYADFAVWQRQWLQGDVLREQLQYWKERLAGAPLVLDLPADHPRPAVQSYRGARFS